MNGYTAYLLDDKKRETLLDVFEPAFPEVIAHHITLEFGTDEDSEIETPETVRITHHITDGNGIEALVIEVNGKSTRADGHPYHLTWSLDTKAALPAYIKDADPKAQIYEAKHANHMIKKALSDDCPDEFTITELDCKLPADTLKPRHLVAHGRRAPAKHKKDGQAPRP